VKKKYLEQNTFEAARERISYIFDEFEEIQVSISGGKDSTALLYLCLLECERRNRSIEVFFLDQEAEYQATIDIIRLQMSLKHVKPLWVQAPVYMTNATSYSDYFLYAWGEGEKWIRPKEPNSVHTLGENAPKRFYEIFPWIESKNNKKAYLVGLRAEESITRYRAVTKYSGYKELRWSTTCKESAASRFYPIYDWTYGDVWKFIYDYNIPYNKIYDLMYWQNYSIYKMRVSNLIHEKSYKCLVDLPRFEPETYNTLCGRVSGISTASRYAVEKLIFSNKKLPAHYKTWKDFRDFLVCNIPNETQRERFLKRFEGQQKTEWTYKQQVGQLLINDYENAKAVSSKTDEKVQATLNKWRQLL
jgi:predicted phosphoadenosine phosphosulfate sulfurtransferase